VFVVLSVVCNTCVEQFLAAETVTVFAQFNSFLKFSFLVFRMNAALSWWFDIVVHTFCLTTKVQVVSWLVLTRNFPAAVRLSPQVICK